MALREQDGLTVEQIAQQMKLNVPRVERLLDEEAQHRDLQLLICDTLPVETLQALIRRRQREDPGLTQAEIATRAGYTTTLGLQRAVGLTPSAKTIRGGKEYPPALRTQIEFTVAAKIVRALGFAPHEVPGL
jgi:AraC-like DNA-binding protein